MIKVSTQTKNILFLSLISITVTFLISYIGYVIFQNSIPKLYDLWNHWDTKWYLSIAASGYQKFGDGRASITYFPLYPSIIRLGTIVFKDYLKSALTVSNLSFILALIVFYKLVKIDFSEKIAWRSIVYFSIFPTAYFLHAGYTESLFLMFTFSAIYFMREKKWFLASILGMLATLTRLNGLVLVPVFLAEYLTNKKLNFRQLKFDIFWVLLIIFGFVFYLYLNFHTFGNPFAFRAVYEEVTWERLSLPWVGLFDAVNRFYRYQLADWMMEGFMVILFWLFDLILLATSLKKIRLSYKIFAWLNFLLMTSTSIWSGLPRYTLLLFPIFIVLARWGEKPVKNYLISICFLFLQGIFLMLFVQGRWTF